MYIYTYIYCIYYHVYNPLISSTLRLYTSITNTVYSIFICNICMYIVFKGACKYAVQNFTYAEDVE